MEEKIESLEKKVSTHDNFMKSMKAAARGSGNPNFFIWGAMGMVKEDQFDKDNSLRPRMATADHGEVAAPDEHDINVKFAEKQVTTIAGNDNSAKNTITSQ